MPRGTVSRRVPTWLLAIAVLAVSACDGAVAAGSPIARASSSGPTIEWTLTARGLELKPADLAAPAGVDILISFDNTDPGVPHGLVLYRDPAHTIEIGSAPLVVGPDRQLLRIAGLPPGRFQFSCVVHPMMTADLVVTS